MLKPLIHSSCLLLCSLNVWAEANTNRLSLGVGAGQAFEFIWIKAGRFVMGAPGSDKLAEADEKPQRLVQIEQGFYLGKTTVTVGQFRQFVQETGYQTDAEADQRPYYQGAHGYNAARHLKNIALCRCAARGFGTPWSRYSYTGIRVALTP